MKKLLWLNELYIYPYFVECKGEDEKQYFEEKFIYPWPWTRLLYLYLYTDPRQQYRGEEGNKP